MAAGVIGIVQGFLMAAANEGAKMIPDGLPLDPAAEVLLAGIAFLVVAMIIWPHREGLRKYIRSIL